MVRLSRKEPPAYPCLNRPELKALSARMVEEASWMLEDVSTYVDMFKKTSRFPEGVFQDLHRFREAYDSFIREMIAQVPLHVRCGKGCSVCCFTLPCGVEPLEVLEIYERVSLWPDFQDIVRDSAFSMKTFERIRREIEGTTGEPVRSGSAGYALALDRYVLQRIPCIFLDREKGHCRIYDIRPLICRAVFSLSDPSVCDPSHPDFGGENHRIEVLEPVDEVNCLLLQINAIVSEAVGVRFPEILPHGLLYCYQRARTPADPAFIPTP